MDRSDFGGLGLVGVETRLNNKSFTGIAMLKRSNMYNDLSVTRRATSGAIKERSEGEFLVSEPTPRNADWISNFRRLAPKWRHSPPA